MLYRIYTEDYANLANLTSHSFDSFTVIKATGYWKGNPEPTTIIEIVANDADAINRLARLIKRTNKQEAVLVTEIALYSDYFI